MNGFIFFKKKLFRNSLKITIKVFEIGEHSQQFLKVFQD